MRQFALPRARQEKLTGGLSEAGLKGKHLPQAMLSGRSAGAKKRPEDPGKHYAGHPFRCSVSLFRSRSPKGSHSGQRGADEHSRHRRCHGSRYQAHGDSPLRLRRSTSVIVRSTRQIQTGRRTQKTLPRGKGQGQFSPRLRSPPKTRKVGHAILVVSNRPRYSSARRIVFRTAILTVIKNPLWCCLNAIGVFYNCSILLTPRTRDGSL